MIVGLNNIARALGVSPGKVRDEYLKRRDFPARKDSDTSPWVTTRHSLTAWAESYINSPDRPTAA
jgi:hypothetical protein